ncbi:MAG: 3-dehydroquinate synthase [Eubacteriales bacterium]|nr:3-dehydroquinate synthase [Eubacteriales bacterium]MDN5364539.1 3-dehydroquinate synthase [Eubacteriales bacterium]
MNIQTVKVNLGERSYCIQIGSGLLVEAGRWVREVKEPCRVMVVSNHTVFSLYGEGFMAALKKEGFEPFPALIPDGEIYKSLDSATRLYSTALAEGLDRNHLVIVLGGGVVGDLGGFVAATYMRGLPYVQVPTTLLAQVDSSVGGKVGVNLPEGKNLVGAFHQPLLVLADVTTLRTLPLREFVAGLAEVIKYGLLGNASFFEWLEERMDDLLALQEEALIHAVTVSCTMKGEIVSRDERESNIRALLNLGHTFGHVVETLSGYTTYLHGEAVAMGMMAATLLSHRRGFLSEEEVARVARLLRRAGLPVVMPRYDAESILAVMRRDKKVRDGRIRVILPEKIGQAKIRDDVTEEEIIAVWEEAAAGNFPGAGE